MPNLKSSKKDVKKSAERKLRNTATKSTIKTFTRRSKEAATRGQAEDANAMLKRAVSVIDKAVKRGILHRNTAARKKSRLMIALNKRLMQMKDGEKHS
ncbi:MAG: 30S ribosomal protein S20 [Fimbriimonadia bacterium]|nr:30S ribosomal protein S20 [Fimbriimonadia bacterium]